MKQFLQTIIGSFELINKELYIYTAIVHTNQPIETPLLEFKTKIIHMTMNTPKFPTDFKLYSFIRTFCKAEFTTGNMVKQDELLGHIMPQIYLSNKEFQELKQEKEFNRDYWIYSRQLSSNDILQFKQFKDENSKFHITMNDNIIQSEELTQFSQKQRIEYIKSFPTITDCLEDYIKQIPKQRTFFDIGPQIIDEALNYLDLYIVTIYSGKLDQEFQGGDMPQFADVLTRFDLIFQSEIIPENLGFLKFLVFQKKVKQEHIHEQIQQQ